MFIIKLLGFMAITASMGYLTIVHFVSMLLPTIL